MNSYSSIFCKWSSAFCVGLAAIWAFLFCTIDTVTLATPVVLLSGLGAIFAILSRWRNSVSLGAPAWSVLIFIGYLITRASFSTVKFYILCDAVMFMSAFFVYFSISQIVQERKIRIFIASIFAFLALFNIVWVFFQYGGKEVWTPLSLFEIEKLEGRSITGMFMHYNYVASYLAMIAPFIVMMMTMGKNRYVKASALLVLIILGGCVFLTKSRGGSLVFVLGVFLSWISMIIFCYLRNKNFNVMIRSLFAGGVIAAVVVSCSVWVFQQRASHNITENAGLFDSSSRLDIFSMAAGQIAKYPIFGGGSHSFTFLCFDHWDERIPTVSSNPVFVHNDHLQLIAEYGSVGYVLFLLVLGTHLFCLLRSKQEGNSTSAYLKGGLLVAFISMLVALAHAVIDFNLHILPITLFFAVLLGFVASGGQSVVQNRRSVLATTTKRFFGFVVCVFVLGASFIAGREFSAGMPLMLSGMGRETGVWTPPAENIQETLWILEEANQKSPRFVWAEKIGACYLKMAFESDDTISRERLFGKALAAYEQALELNPKSIVSPLNIAQIHSDLGNLKLAEKYWIDIIPIAGKREHWYSSNQKMGVFYTNWADKEASDGNKKLAEDLYEKAVFRFHRSLALTQNWFHKRGPQFLIDAARSVALYGRILAERGEFEKSHSIFLRLREGVLKADYHKLHKKHLISLNEAVAQQVTAQKMFQNKEYEESLFLYKESLKTIDFYQSRFPNMSRKEISLIKRSMLGSVKFIEGGGIQPKKPRWFVEGIWEGKK